MAAKSLTDFSPNCDTKRSYTHHGWSYTREYRNWNSMIQRCYNPKHPQYHDYGGRGIGTYYEWRNSFEKYITNVIAEIGPKPSPEYSLDRINNNGNYEPGNIRWATREEQLENRRDYCDDATLEEQKKKAAEDAAFDEQMRVLDAISQKYRRT